MEREFEIGDIVEIACTLYVVTAVIHDRHKVFVRVPDGSGKEVEFHFSSIVKQWRIIS